MPKLRITIGMRRTLPRLLVGATETPAPATASPRCDQRSDAQPPPARQRASPSSSRTTATATLDPHAYPDPPTPQAPPPTQDQTPSTAAAPHPRDEPAPDQAAPPPATPRSHAPPCSCRSRSRARPPRSHPAHTHAPPTPPTTCADARSTPAPTPDKAQQSATHRSCHRDTPPQPNILPQPTNPFVTTTRTGFRELTVSYIPNVSRKMSPNRTNKT